MGKDRDVCPGDINVSSLERCAEIYFGKSVTLKAYVTRENKKQKSRDRLLWPVPMVCACESIGELEKKVFEASLNLVGCHFVLWSWYFAVAKALRNSAAWMNISCLFPIVPAV